MLDMSALVSAAGALGYAGGSTTFDLVLAFLSSFLASAAS